MAERPVALMIVSDREPLAWLLRDPQFAVPAARATAVPAQGSQVLLYTTRGCYRNPGRDRGLVVGRATVTTEPKTLAEPVRFRELDFHVGFDVRIEGLAAPHDGVKLAPLAGSLDALPDPASWSARMRRTFIPLTSRDASRLIRQLTHRLRTRAVVLPGYMEACRVAATIGGTP